MLSTRRAVSRFFKLLIVLFVLVLNGQIFGQDVDSVESKNGYFSMRYQIGGNFDVTSFNGNFLSIQYITPTNFAFVLGLSGSFMSTYGDSKTTIEEELYSFPGDQSKNDFGLYLQMHYQLQTSSEMLFYFGVGPFVGSSYSEYRGYNYYYREIPSFRPDVQKYEKKYIGCSFNIGGEYFILRKLSILAESSLEPSFQKRTNKYIETNVAILESSRTYGWEIDTVVKFGFAFHFSR